MAERAGTAPAPVVLSMGGSVLVTGDEDARFLPELATLLRRLSGEFPLVVTAGGGRVARDYIRLGRALGLTETELDELGIDVSRLNARLLASVIGPPCPAHPPTSLAEAVREAHRSSIVVLGGTEPGHTTDGVAGLLAERLRARRLVNATRVPGLFERDPRKDPTARRIDRLDYAGFRRMIDASVAGTAGQQFVFDRLGLESLARAQIPLRIVQGRDLSNLEKALRGEDFVGTEIR
ncbi:MAG TPA: UMP kinase [Thermoplasmata archaeon]|nr:UMP kinase [Thermoplasmata archaeon]